MSRASAEVQTTIDYLVPTSRIKRAIAYFSKY